MAITALEDRIIVKVAAVEEKSPSGLYIPETAQEKPTEAEVLSVGEGYLTSNGERTPLTIKVGDRIIFAKHAGIPIKHEDENYLLLFARDVYAVVN